VVSPVSVCLTAFLVMTRFGDCLPSTLFSFSSASALGQCPHPSVRAQVIAIDGKTLKQSYDRNDKLKALHLVSAWASEHRLVLAQVKVDQKSNQITAIPALLELLDIKGCIITIDAMGAQRRLRRRLSTSKQITCSHSKPIMASSITQCSSGLSRAYRRWRLPGQLL